MRLSSDRCVTLWSVAHVSEWRAFTACPGASLSQIPVLVCGSGGLGELEGLEESLFLYLCVSFTYSFPRPLFLFCPGEFKSEVNRNIY